MGAVEVRVLCVVYTIKDRRRYSVIKDCCGVKDDVVTAIHMKSIDVSRITTNIYRADVGSKIYKTPTRKEIYKFVCMYFFFSENLMVY